MLPQAAIGDGLLACSDGSLVSLFRIDGARSMTGGGGAGALRGPGLPAPQ